MRMPVSISKGFGFIFTIALLLILGVQGNLSYGDTTRPQIYWTDPGTSKIQRADLDGSNLEDLATTELFSVPGGIALDVTDGKIYWTFAGLSAGIQCANLDGSDVENLVEMGLFDPPVDIALDIAAGKMYWTVTGFSMGIQRANLDGSDVENLVEMDLFSESSLEGIALDVIDGKMYWTDTGTDKIQRANLDGSDIEDLVIGVEGVEGPRGIALDVAGGKIYWTDWIAEKIQRADLDGSNVEDLITTGLDSPIGIALDVAGGKMYWTHGEWDEDAEALTNGKIQRANLDGSDIEDLITTGLGSPIGIALSISSGVSRLAPFDLDVTGDGSITHEDIIEVAENFGKTVADGANPRADVNRDGKVDMKDLTRVAKAVKPAPLDLDVTGDGNITHEDIVEVAKNLGKTIIGGANPRADVNRDGKVDIEDLFMVAEAVEPETAAPALTQRLSSLPFTAQTLQQWLSEAKRRHLSARGIAALEHLLAALTPKETALLPNYPNPFNPETWIPYQLSTPADVTFTIYAVNGQVVRRLALGHQPTGMYQSRSRAAYWDGRNAHGEPVASGVYFYTLTAGDFTATCKLLIRK